VEEIRSTRKQNQGEEGKGSGEWYDGEKKVQQNSSWNKQNGNVRGKSQALLQAERFYK
jgi:hypothetical protein